MALRGKGQFPGLLKPTLREGSKTGGVVVLLWGAGGYTGYAAKAQEYNTGIQHKHPTFFDAEDLQ